MADSAILRARDLKFSPKILKKYLKNRFEKNGLQKSKMANKKKWSTQPHVRKYTRENPFKCNLKKET